MRSVPRLSYSQMTEKEESDTKQLLTKQLNIGIILYEGVTVLDFMGPCQYFDILRSVWNAPIEIYTIAKAVGPLYSDEKGSIPYYANTSMQDVIDRDLQLNVVLIPGAAPMYIENVLAEVDYFQFIKESLQRSEHILSICSGARIVAATGILDGKAATTNKFLFEYVTNDFPNVDWKIQARWVQDGHIWSSSGISAGMDLIWGFLASMYGQKIADTAAVFLEIIPSRQADIDPFTPTSELVEQWKLIHQNLSKHAALIPANIVSRIAISHTSE